MDKKIAVLNASVDDSDKKLTREFNDRIEDFGRQIKDIKSDIDSRENVLESSIKESDKKLAGMFNERAAEFKDYIKKIKGDVDKQTVS